MACGSESSKLSLLIFNALVLITSIILIAIGGYVVKNGYQYIDLFGEDGIGTLTNVSGLIIAVGCFLFLVGLFGCYGAWNKEDLYLKLYFAFLFILVLMQLIGGIVALVHRNNIKHYIETTLKGQVEDFYGLEDHKAFSYALDDLQRDEKCCGAEDYTDYYNSVFSTLPDFKGQAVPISCCKVENIHCPVALPNGEMADVTKIYNCGCMSKLSHIFENYFTYIGVTALVLIFVEIAAVISSLCLICALREEDAPPPL